MATYLKPQPTTAPTVYGIKSYYPMSSRTNTLASNYQSPMSVPGSTQLNAFGAPLYSSNAWNTNNRVVSTNPLTGQITPQAGPAPSPTPNPNNGQDVINQNAGDQNSVIDQDYEDAMSALNSQEATMRSQSQAAEGTLENEALSTRNQIANQQATDISGQESQVATGETQAKTAMQEARDLFRQTQQNNIAQLSATGLSSSSVAEALAEKLGVETARRIAGVTGSIQEIRQNATKEIARIKSYYEGKSTEVTQWVANEKLKIQNALMTSLDQINAARNTAASAKAQARASLLSDVRSQIYDLAQKEQQFQQSLTEWATKKAAATESLVTDPNLVSQYTQNIATLNQTPGITQSYIGNYGVDNSGNVGYYSGAVKSTKKDEEDATNPFVY